MAVDLSDYVEALRAKANPPGEELYPEASPEDWRLRLSNAFWDGYLHRMFRDFTEAEGTVSAKAEGGANMPRDQIQLIVLYAALDALLARLGDLKTQFRGQSGPTEIEYQRSAQVLTEIIKARRAELAEITADLARRGVTATYFLDATAARAGTADGAWVR